MGERWTADQVLSLAPDAASVKAGQKLAVPTPWTDTGATDRVVWGLCKGSGKTPYQTIVEPAAPAYKCSCPSRKFPCKHALALLLLWSEHAVPDAGGPSAYAAAWLAGREQRAVRAAAPAAPRDPERAEKTAAQRAERVRAGIDELQLWLADQVGNGLAGADADAYSRFDAVAARLVDAQAPGLAARVRRLPQLIAGSVDERVDWPARLLAELGWLWTLAVAHQRLAELPEALRLTVRRHVGYPVGRADVMATPGVTDAWLVLGRRDAAEDHLQSRRTWLRGAGTGRFALLLDYAPTGGSLPMRPVIGAVLCATLHFYPGAPGLRCLVDDAAAVDTGAPAGSASGADALAGPPPAGLTSPPTTDIAAARRTWAAAVADDPWLRSHPVLIAGRLARTADDRPAILDDTGDAIALTGIAERWPLLVAVTGGARVGVFGELGAAGLDPFAILDGPVVIAV